MTSKLPFEGLATGQVVKKVCLDGGLPDMTQALNGCPQVLTDVTTKCLAQAPGLRPSFASLVSTLQEAEAVTGGFAQSTVAAIAATLRTNRPGGGAVDDRIQALEDMSSMLIRELKQTQDSVAALRLELDRARAVLQHEIALCATADEVVTMLEGRVVELKEYVSALCKTVPRPSRIDASRKWLGTRKVLKLVFVCPVTGFEMTVESGSWSLWLKVAFSLVMTGYHVLEGDLVDSFLQVTNKPRFSLGFFGYPSGICPPLHDGCRSSTSH